MKPEQAETEVVKKPRKRKLQDPNAPRRPDSGYIRYFKHVKEELVTAGSWSGPGSVALIAGKWGALPPDEKASFLAAAEVEREAWRVEQKAYLAGEEHAKWKAKVMAEAKRKEKEASLASPEFGALGPGRLPVFSPEFLAHSREREAELRRLCGEVRRAEEEAAALETRRSAVPGAIAALKSQSERSVNSGLAASALLAETQRALLTALTAVPDPETGKPPSAGGLPDYLEALSSAAANGGNPELQRQLAKALAAVQLS